VPAAAGLVLAFGCLENLSAAYGIAVAGTMVITTGLLSLVSIRVPDRDRRNVVVLGPRDFGADDASRSAGMAR